MQRATCARTPQEVAFRPHWRATSRLSSPPKATCSGAAWPPRGKSPLVPPKGDLFPRRYRVAASRGARARGSAGSRLPFAGARAHGKSFFGPPKATSRSVPFRAALIRRPPRLDPPSPASPCSTTLHATRHMRTHATGSRLSCALARDKSPFVPPKGDLFHSGASRRTGAREVAFRPSQRRLVPEAGRGKSPFVPPKGDLFPKGSRAHGARAPCSRAASRGARARPAAFPVVGRGSRQGRRSPRLAERRRTVPAAVGRGSRRGRRSPRLAEHGRTGTAHGISRVAPHIRAPRLAHCVSRLGAARLVSADTPALRPAPRAMCFAPRALHPAQLAPCALRSARRAQCLASRIMRPANCPQRTVRSAAPWHHRTQPPIATLRLSGVPRPAPPH